MARGDLRMLCPGDPGFPSVVIEEMGALLPQLWVRGQARVLRVSPRVTVVGSRAASQRGLERARALSRALAEQGALVISGGALGIDAAAHEGALEAGGSTCAVLGTGADQVYPAHHADLFTRIARTGCLLSMFDLGAVPRRAHFPQRNRLMAALADVVVVVEAQLHSGTESTARAAREFRRPVICFPDSPGTEALLQFGARPVDSVAQAVALVLGSSPDVQRKLPLDLPLDLKDPTKLASAGEADEDFLPLSAQAEQLAGVLRESPFDLGELCARTGLIAAECAAALIELELRGRCSRLPGGRYIGHSPLS